MSIHSRRMRWLRHPFLVLIVALPAVLVGSGCQARPSTPPETQGTSATGPDWFADVTEASGLSFTHDPGPTGSYFMPQSMGSGAACLDFDSDGLLDIYLLSFGGANASTTNCLYRQVTPGQFRDVSEGSGLDLRGQYHGVAVGDVNNDGKPDLVLTGFGFVQLMLNQGGGHFKDVTQEAGLINLSWGVSAGFLDYDRDGWLDLFVVNYLDYDPRVECRSPEGVLDFCGPNSFTGTTSKLFHNLGAENGSPRFQDVSLQSGIGKVRGPGLGVTLADLNGDGWIDAFVANDGQPNRLWINQKDGTFAEEAVSRGAALTAMGRAYAGMGVALGDVDNDGLFDLFVTHLGSEQNNLWRQGPRGQFRDRTAEFGLATSQWRGTGFGTLMADFDHNGHLDIAVVNGKVFRGGSAQNTGLGFWETYAEKNQLFVNDGTGKFRDASRDHISLCGYWNVARGLVCADFDNDGAPDLLVAPIGDRARLLRNVAPNRGNWLKVRALDEKSKRDAYGAEIRIRADGKDFVRLINPADSYLSSSSPLAHFGLGSVNHIEWIRVQWPDGAVSVTEQFDGGPVNQLITLKRGKGKVR